MYFSKEQIEQSVKRLNDLNPFFGMTFLAFQQAKLPVGTTKSIKSVSILDAFLRKYYHPIADYPGFYTPFKTWDNKRKSWNAALYANSLHVTATQTFSDVFIHPKGSSNWGWQKDYVNILMKNHMSLTRNLIPAFDLAVWLFRLHDWQESVSAENIIAEFFAEFGIEDDARVLFDSAISPLTSSQMSRQSINESDLLDIIGHPPGRITEGALLQTLKLTGVGPAEKIEIELAPRLNLITGDNALGKTFLLECAWWALTGNWVRYPAHPRKEAQSSSIAFQIGKQGHRGRTQTIKYKWDELSWDIPAKRNTLPGLCIFAQIDGSFAVWDPAKYTLAGDKYYQGSPTDALTLFDRTTILRGWNEKDRYGRIQSAPGLINDWLRWQEAADQTRFEELSAALYALSPHSDQEFLIPGSPGRTTEIGNRSDVPTLRFPYGEVLITDCSAGVQRIVSLAYLLIWAWQEHLKISENMRKPPAQSIVLLIDEMEAHLHPLWQRSILPAVMNTVQAIASEVQVQTMFVTHSPLVMASVEPIFDRQQDKLFHFHLEDSSVLLDDVDFIKQGRADQWLTSEIFGLAQPRSIEAENAINEANEVQIEDDVSLNRIQDISDRLVKYLAPDDEFWPLWTYFAKEKGVRFDARR